MPQQASTSGYRFRISHLFAGLAALGLLVAMCMGGIAGCKEFNRYQTRQDRDLKREQARNDAKNKVVITRTQIQTAQQQALVTRAQIEATKARAQMRYQESIGIRKAQDEIAATLTPLYVQHEAIEAQRAAANSPNHTQVYIPSGEQGVPLVKTTP